MDAKEFKARYRFDTHTDLLAEGTYSRVFKAYDQLLQRDICIKLYRKEFLSGSPLVKELSRAGVYFHPNICAYYDLLEVAETNVLGEVEPQPIGVVEYMNGGTITQYLQSRKQDVELNRRLIKDVLNGLMYLHSLNKPHYDLKPENILIKETDGQTVAKITDFLNSENLHTRTVPASIEPSSLAYKAPEYFESNTKQLSPKADVWSLGLIVYEIFTGKKLFYKTGDTAEKIIRAICYGDYYPALHVLPEPFKLFCEKCLLRDPESRTISLEELMVILQTPSPAPIVAKVLDTKPQPKAVAAALATEQATSEVTSGNKGNVAPPSTQAVTIISTEKKSRAWVLPLALLAIAGITTAAYLTGINSNIHTYQTPSPKNNLVAAVPTTVVATKPAKSVEPIVIHDTVKVVQIVQAPAAKPNPAPPLRMPPPLESSTNVSNVSNGNNVSKPVLPDIPNMWVGKPYYFDLKTPLLSEEEFSLFSNEAAITSLGQNTFYVKPMQSGEVFVQVVSKRSGKQIAQRKYYVRDQKLPVATIGDDVFGGFVSPKLLLAKLTLQAKGETGRYRIKSFRMTCKSGSCDLDDISNSDRFNESMIRTLRNVKPGEKLYFDNIIAEDEQGEQVRLNDIQVTTY